MVTFIEHEPSHRPSSVHRGGMRHRGKRSSSSKWRGLGAATAISVVGPRSPVQGWRWVIYYSTATPRNTKMVWNCMVLPSVEFIIWSIGSVRTMCSINSCPLCIAGEDVYWVSGGGGSPMVCVATEVGWSSSALLFNCSISALYNVYLGDLWDCVEWLIIPAGTGASSFRQGKDT